MRVSSVFRDPYYKTNSLQVQFTDDAYCEFGLYINADITCAFALRFTGTRFPNHMCVNYKCDL